MTISLAQFAAAFPLASPATQSALFTRDTSLTPAIERILDTHGITEPPVVAQFLAACGLASDGFTEFGKPGCQVCVREWLTERAKEWQDAGANEDAAAWLWLDLIDGYIGTVFGIPVIYWNEVHKTLATVCAALGVEDRSDTPLPLE